MLAHRSTAGFHRMQFSFRVLPLAISAMFCWSAALSGTPHECDRAWFCDGFEDDEVGRLPGAPWSDQTYGTGAIIEVDADRVFSGRHSLHVLAPKSRPRRGYLAIHGSPVFPAASRGMYGRVMIWLDAAPVAAQSDAPVHWTLLQGEGRAAGDRTNAIYRLGLEQRDGLGLMANYETTPPVRSDCRQHSVRDLPVARWTCVEWHFDGHRDELQFWLDGAELRDIHVVGRGDAADSHCAHQDDLRGRWLAPPAFQSIFMGIERYDASTNDQNLWLDEVVVAPQRVGCPVPPSGEN
jgi:hypothetical protein